MPLSGSLKPNSVYLALSSRPNPSEYHWGIVSTDEKAECVLYHVTNRDGPWRFEERHGDPSISDMSLIALFHVSALIDHHGAVDVVRSVLVDGKSSLRTGEDFTCRIWVKDALMALHDSGKIKLLSDIESLEAKAREKAALYAQFSESGGGAQVVN